MHRASRNSLLASALFLAATNMAAAGCIANPPNESPLTFPSLNGRLLYHSYVNYGDGTSQIFLYDFTAKTLTQLSTANWGVRDPMNAVFSPDGAWVVFMAVQNNAWNIFIYRLGSNAAPVNLTKSTGATRNEDVKFSLDGAKLVFKQNGDLKLAPLVFTNGVPALGAVQSLTQTMPATENSMPFLSPDASTVYFATGSGSALALWSKPAAPGGVNTPVDGGGGLPAFYPIVRYDGVVFYAKWNNTSSKLYQIYAKASPSVAPVQQPFNDCISQNADAWPVNGTNYVFFSSTTAGGYQLYLGDAATGKRWTLTPYGVNADTTKGKFGSSYR